MIDFQIFAPAFKYYNEKFRFRPFSMKKIKNHYLAENADFLVYKVNDGPVQKDQTEPMGQ